MVSKMLVRLEPTPRAGGRRTRDAVGSKIKEQKARTARLLLDSIITQLTAEGKVKSHRTQR